ncbi:MAG TPA: hypothetical protein VFO41_04855, partial [Alphaproteobacteria bacterium]|nr:hypothetical protein [Alphaproteobacteria bacterium]
SVRSAPAPAPSPAPAPLAARMVDGLCHDCRTPLTVIAELAGIVREDLGRSVPAETIDFLWTIGEKVREIEALVADFALVDRLTRRGPRIGEAVDIGELLTAREAEIGPLAKAFSKTIVWSGLTSGRRVALPRDEAVTAVSALVDNLYRIPGDVIVARVSAAPETVAGNAVTLECMSGDVAVGEPSWTLAAPDQLSFRQQVAAAIAGHYGGRLELLDGAEYRACRLVLPAVAPEPLRREPLQPSP